MDITEITYSLGGLQTAVEALHTELVEHAQDEQHNFEQKLRPIKEQVNTITIDLKEIKEQLLKSRIDNIIVRSSSHTIMKVLLVSFGIAGWIVAKWDWISQHVHFN